VKSDPGFGIQSRRDVLKIAQDASPGKSYPQSQSRKGRLNPGELQEPVENLNTVTLW
jgi:hypothetical protein